MSDFERELRDFKETEIKRINEDVSNQRLKAEEAEKARKALEEAQLQETEQRRLEAFERFVRPIKGEVDGMLIALGNETWGNGNFSLQFRNTEDHGNWELGRTSVSAYKNTFFGRREERVWVPEVNISVADWKSRRYFNPQGWELFRLRLQFGDSPFFYTPERDTYIGWLSDNKIGNRTDGATLNELKTLVKQEHVRGPIFYQYSPSTYIEAFPPSSSWGIDRGDGMRG